MSTQNRQQQHVHMNRKVRLRQRLLKLLPEPSVAYVPYIGEGDIVAELYRPLYVLGADINPQFLETARQRLPSGEILAADVEAAYPFGHYAGEIHIADFDAYANPFTAFRLFWEHAHKAERMALFFTDGGLVNFGQRNTWKDFHGVSHRTANKTEMRRVLNFYLRRHVWPLFEGYIAPYGIVKYSQYKRDAVHYWGAIVQIAQE